MPTRDTSGTCLLRLLGTGRARDKIPPHQEFSHTLRQLNENEWMLNWDRLRTVIHYAAITKRVSTISGKDGLR